MIVFAIAALAVPRTVAADAPARAKRTTASASATLRAKSSDTRTPMPSTLRLRPSASVEGRRALPLTRPSVRPSTPRAHEPPEVPWFWEALRARVYSHMPQMQRRDFTMTVAPVVVTGTDDTVPGLGVSGDF